MSVNLLEGISYDEACKELKKFPIDVQSLVSEGNYEKALKEMNKSIICHASLRKYINECNKMIIETIKKK